MKRLMVVTGASSGLGREFALAVAKKYRPEALWLVARRCEKLESLVAELPPGMAVAKCIDLASSSGVSTLVSELQEAIHQGWSLDLLINNAGFGTYGQFAETELPWQLEMIQLNVMALTTLSWHAVQLMQSGACVINVASLASFMPLGNFATYAATKAYVLSLSVALAAELEGKGILVHALCPGPVRTEFSAVASRGARKNVPHGQDPIKVVDDCLSKVERRRVMSVYTWSWKWQVLLSRLASRMAIARYTFRHMRRPRAD
jgi:short-subunit dehydrogenase